MRHAAAFAIAVASGLGLSFAAGGARAEYFCSPGFEPSYGGTCVAVPARAEIELFVDQPLLGGEQTVVRHYRRHRRHGLRERY